MSDENVGGLPELPEPVRMSSDQAYLGFTAEQLHAYADARVEAALSAHGQPVVDVEATRESFERWLMKRHGFGVERWADSGEYRYHNTREFWECWKLALTGDKE